VARSSMLCECSSKEEFLILQYKKKIGLSGGG